jgi:predicted MFS family arabinose efflux permease
LLGGIYAICGFQDFFVATHVVAFALDIGFGTLIAGNLLALMGVMGLLGVLVSGFLADRIGPARPTLLCFAMRIGIFVLVILSQSKPAVMMFALLYGFTFLMTAPLTVIFSGNIFGTARLGRISGTISMIHQISGGIGALAGALAFDIWGSYDRAFVMMLVLSVVATVGTLLVRDRTAGATAQEGISRA